MYPLYAFGATEQQQMWLPKMITGEVIGCFGLTESDAGSDPNSMRTTAKKVEGGWCLNGSKLWITNATIAHIAIIWAKTDQGIRGFIVETTTEGFSALAIAHKLSLRASDTGELVLKDCFVPDEALLPGTTEGLAAALKCLTQARFGIAFGAIGAAMACFDAALSYTKTRKQFNRPIAGFQLIQKSLADMFTEIVKAQSLNLTIARLMDANQATFVQVSMAKRNACEQALYIAREARNLLGANGISGEYPVMRHLQNLETVFTYEGTHNMHTLILGKHITGLGAFA
jgi:glutaryl-CoA dehydrogenase